MKEHPDIILVTDKISDPDILNPYFLEIADRVVVECFSDSDYYTLGELGYECFRSMNPPSKRLHLFLKILEILHIGTPVFDKYACNIQHYTDKVNLPWYLWYRRPPKFEMAIFSAANKAEADSLFVSYPDVKFIYVDDIE